MLFEEELDAIAAIGNSVHFTLLGIAFGAFVTITTVVLSVALSDRQYMVFIASALACFGLSVICAVNSGRDWYRANCKLRDLQGRKQDAVVTSQL